jgi:cardiolipin synthase
VALRIVASAPATAGLMRLDHLIASIARRRLWLTDAYFVPVTTYVNALAAAAGTTGRRSAARARLERHPLVSRSLPIGFPTAPRSRSARFRVERHDDAREDRGRRRLWARVGSSNLNLASFVGNYELDVAVEDAGFAVAMERQYSQDLDRATELVLQRRSDRQRPCRPNHHHRAPAARACRGAPRARRRARCDSEAPSARRSCIPATSPTATTGSWDRRAGSGRARGVRSLLAEDPGVACRGDRALVRSGSRHPRLARTIGNPS